MKQRIAIIVITALILAGLVLQVRHETQVRRAYSVENLIRLHVIANSDSTHDQQVKYQVRDQLVQALQPQLSRAKDCSEARRIVQQNSGVITKLANRILKTAGYNYASRVELGRFPFPARVYGNLAFPAGDYEAVRVVLGEGSGANWWCVLFPPLCFVDISRSNSSAALENVNSQVEQAVAQGRDNNSNSEVVRVLGDNAINIRFRIIDWLRDEQSHMAGNNHT